MDAYRDFAGVYDVLMDETPYEQWCERIMSLIRQYGVSRPRKEAFGESVCSPEKSSEETNLCQEKSSAGTNLCQGEPSAEMHVDRGEFSAETHVDREELFGEHFREELYREELLASERDLVVDLGCGTGTMAELLYRRGYDVIGIDSSPEMLDEAMKKKEQSGSEILYLQQDMRELELYSTVGTVVSVCDSLNYILEEDELLEVFERVNNYLYPGGTFIFDFNTVYKYEQVIGDTTIAENREGVSFIWENCYDPEESLNEYDLTVFVQSEGDHFRKFTETHLQRGYTQEQICALLVKAGLKVLLVKDADTDGEVTDTTERIYVVAGECSKSRVISV